MTDAEQLLWRHLKGKQLCGTKFNRQKPLLNFIVDFYSAKAKLVIEVDGSQHFTEDNIVRDQERDMALNEIGLRVMRFDNRQVLTETEAVLHQIYTTVCEGERA